MNTFIRGWVITARYRAAGKSRFIHAKPLPNSLSARHIQSLLLIKVHVQRGLHYYPSKFSSTTFKAERLLSRRFIARLTFLLTDTPQEFTFSNTTVSIISLLLLLISSSSSSSPSSTLCRVFILIFLRQNYASREQSVAAILLLLFMVLIWLVSVLNLLYFYISTFRSMCAVPSMAVFCSSLTS